MLPGSKVRLAAPHCEECICSKTGLQCCGFGFKAGVVIAPPGCVTHNDGCKLIFVKATNATQKCEGTKPPGSGSGSKKKHTAPRRP